MKQNNEEANVYVKTYFHTTNLPSLLHWMSHEMIMLLTMLAGMMVTHKSNIGLIIKAYNNNFV